MKIKLQKIIAVIAAASMMSSAAAFSAYAAGDVDYTINSTYADVDWSTYNQYKADFHSHTTATDGDFTRKQSIEAHYKYGFDIMAMTDHGTVDYGWDKDSVGKVIRFATVVKEGYRPVEPIQAEGETYDGKKYTYADDYYKQYNDDGTAGHTMMRVQYGNEQNPTSFNNAHVCSWFVDYGNDKLGGTSDYITPIWNVDRKGGLCVINHPGEYSGARNAKNFEEAYNMKNVHYKYVVNKYANLLKDYPACIGIDINSKGDYRTRYDRKLWDLLLQKVVPEGRNVYAIATSDAHRESIVNSGYSIMLMSELTNDALRSSMEKGEFFAASRYMGSRVELETWAAELKAAGKGTELAAELDEAVAKIYAEEADDGQDTIYQFDADAKAPKVTGVSVDDNADTISISTKDAYLVHWVADGKYIATGNTIDLDDYSNEIGSYVRAEIIGEGGVIYTQAFTLEYDGAPAAEKDCFVDLGYAATIGDVIVKALAIVLKYTGIIDLVMHIVSK